MITTSLLVVYALYEFLLHYILSTAIMGTEWLDDYEIKLFTDALSVPTLRSS